MAKNNQPTGYYDPQTGVFIPAKKKKVWPWIVAAVVLIGIIGAGAGGNKSNPETAPTSENKTSQTQTSEKTASVTPTGTDAAPEEDVEAKPAAPDFSDVPTEYTLTAIDKIGEP